MQFKDGKLVINVKAGFEGGSAKARAQLLEAVNSKDHYNLKAVDTTAVMFAEVEKHGTKFIDDDGARTDYVVSIDFKDFESLEGDSEAKEAFSVGLAAMHEFAHPLYQISDYPNWTIILDPWNRIT